MCIGWFGVQGQNGRLHIEREEEQPEFIFSTTLSNMSFCTNVYMILKNLLHTVHKSSVCDVTEPLYQKTGLVPRALFIPWPSPPMGSSWPREQLMGGFYCGMLVTA